MRAQEGARSNSRESQGRVPVQIVICDEFSVERSSAAELRFLCHYSRLIAWI